MSVIEELRQMIERREALLEQINEELAAIRKVLGYVGEERSAPAGMPRSKPNGVAAPVESAASGTPPEMPDIPESLRRAVDRLAGC